MRPISVAPSTPIPPSFLISGAPTKVAPVLRLDQINSQLVIQAARRVLFEALDHCAPGADVCGVVLKANPAKYTYASSGNGSSQHLSGEMFKLLTGTNVLHVPYKGSGDAIKMRFLCNISHP